MTRRSESTWNSTAIPERVTERAYTRWKPEGDCWISTYSTASHGYAQIGWKDGGERHMALAHRAAWEHVNGPMEVGMTLDHRWDLCSNRNCVNPSHLRVLSNYENARRTRGRDWPLGECAHGHPQSETYRKPSGKRVCRLCNQIWQARYRAKRALAA